MKVEFHTDVADKQGFVCRLLRKSQGAGAAVAVAGDRQALDRLDLALWTFDTKSFVAHARLHQGASPAPALTPTRLWLIDEPKRAPMLDVLVNLGPEMAQGWESFERVIEIVSTAPEDVAAGRQRWRAYREHLGSAPLNHRHGSGEGTPA